MSLTTACNNNSSRSEQVCHVAVFPFPFLSHPISMLNLTLKLALEARHVRFSFFNTAKSNAWLFGQPKYLSPPANLKAYDVDDGVPDGHVSSGSPFESVDLFLGQTPEKCFKTAVDSAVSETGLKVTSLLTDVLLISSGDFARDYLNGVPWIVLYTAFPCLLSALLHTDLIRDLFANNNNDQDTSLDLIPGLCRLSVKDLPVRIIRGYEEDSPFMQAVNQTRAVLPQGCTVLVLKYYDTLGPEGLSQYLKSKFQKVLNVGFLTMAAFSDEPATCEGDRAVMTWLEEQEEGSVVYVSFGTMAAQVMSSEEMIELAEALEESGFPFLWSLKDNLKANFLPEGFEERTHGRGKVVPWAPQQEVLQHRSVGVFVTHGGSNSVYESIFGQVPMICRPFGADQLIVAGVVEKVWEIGVRIEGENIRKVELLKSLDVLLKQDENRKLMRERMRKMKEAVLEASTPNGSAAGDFISLVAFVSSPHNAI